MLHRRSFLGASLAIGLAAGLANGAPAAALAAEPLDVVASFSILGDMVEQVGGDRIRVVTLVGPDGDAHVYQPTPADARAVAAADLLVVNGLGFEGWLDRLIRAAGYQGAVVIATAGITPMDMDEHDDGHAHSHDHAHDHGHAHRHGHDHGDIDPHAWQSVPNARIYVQTITAALVAADPDGADAYRANAERYGAELDAVDQEIRGVVATLPPERRKVITSHDAFNYFGAEYGLAFLSPVGVSTEAEASAADVAALIRRIREEAIPAIFMENISDPRLLEQIQRETDARIGGTLYSDALSGPDGPAGTYLDMMRHNIRTMAGALST